MNFLFRPVGILAGLAAGLIAKKAFETVWTKIDDQEPPDAEHRELGSRSKFVVALLLEGAIFTLVRGVVDHNARLGFSKYTGAWPGQEYPDQD
ncbi:MAG: DUF4235 domain-containing protein [Solirubrobacterales bacterium]